MMHQQRVGRSG